MRFILLVMLISYSSVFNGACLSVYNGEKVEHSGCRRNNNETITCNNIPNDIPTGTLQLRLNIKTPGTLVLNSSTFMAENWSKLRILEINENEHTHVVFKDYCFNGLRALEEIHIHVWFPEIFKMSFSGLNNVNTLDLSGCANITIEQFKLALNGSTILPALNKIVLSNWNFYQGSYAFDDTLVETLLPRNISDIDISKSQISDINLKAAVQKLTHLKVFNASYTTISDLSDSAFAPEDAKHVQVLDLSHAVLPRKMLPVLPGKQVIYNYTGNFSNGHAVIFRRLLAPETVNYSNIILHLTSFWLYNVTVIIDENPAFFTKTIKFQQNNLKRVDVRLLCETYHFSSVHTLDVSDNGMEFLHPTFLSCFQNLKRIDLSENQLFKMVAEDSTLFQNMFSGLEYLKFIGLSSNGLHEIPSKLFQNRRSIEEIDLSYNRFEQVDFSLNDLENLQVLDLEGNNIHILDSLSMNHLNSIPQGSIVNTSSTTVILKSNPISCSVCAAKPFLQWLISTNLINTDSQRLKCFDENGKHNDLNDNTIDMVQKVCERKTIIISISISAAIFLFISITCALIVYKRYKEKQRKRNTESVINCLREGQGQHKFAVFLSFSNQDEEFVNTHILDQLNENLQLMTGIDRTLVCTGDRYFRPGFLVHEETCRQLETASVVFVVISKNFCNSEYCCDEVKQSYERRKPIILMFIEHVDEQRMNPTIKLLYKRNTRILWTVENGDYVLKTSWENICMSILDLIECKD